MFASFKTALSVMLGAAAVLASSGLMAQSSEVSAQFLGAQRPAGITLQSGKIERLMMDGAATELPTVALAEPLNENFSINLWLRIAPSAGPLLADTGRWTDANPMTVYVIKSADNSQRLVVRLPAESIAVAATAPAVSGWPTFKSRPVVQTNNWYMLTLTKAGTRSAIYLNGELLIQDFATPSLSGLDRIEFGRFGRLRPLFGEIGQPRFFNTELSPEQVKALAAKPPAFAVRAATAAAPQQSAAPAQTIAYRTLQVADTDLHPLIEQLHVSATVVPVEGRQDLLVCGTRPSYFGWRLAYYRQLGVDVDGLPYYDKGTTVENMPGSEFLSVQRKNGFTDLFASGQGSAYGTGTLLYYENQQANQFKYAAPRPVLIDGKHLAEIIKTSVGGWYVGMIDEDDIPDFLIAITKPGRSSYWPDGESMWGTVERVNSGKDRGYDVQGRWLGGEETTSELYWAKGRKEADGSIHFGALQKVSYRVPGFGVQWKAGERERALAVVNLESGPVLLHTGSVDHILAMPYRIENGEMICEEAQPLLSGGATIKGTYFVHSIATMKRGDKGEVNLLLDGNPGRLIAISGTQIGNFEEIGSLQMQGGSVAADSLATPARVDWNGDGNPDLIIGDASGWLTYWQGTEDPWVYRGGKHMQADGTVIHHQAGLTGSIQGPNEKRWGYLQPTVGDWDDNGELAIITNDVEGYLTLYRRGASETELSAPEVFSKDGRTYQSAWRSRPSIVPASYRYAGEQRPALLHLDHDGHLAVARVNTAGDTEIAALDKLTYADGSPILLCGAAGSWGRAELTVTDWDGDGRWDVVFGTIRGNHRVFLENPPGGATPMLLKNIGSNEAPIFAPASIISPKEGPPINLGIHTSPAWPTHLESKGLPDLIVGAENGKVYGFLRKDLED